MPVGISNTDWAYIFLSVVFVYWQPFVNSQTFKTYYHIKILAEKNRMSLPPAQFFGVAWFILYGLISASLSLFFINSRQGGSFVTAIFSLYFVNILINKTWTFAFFTLERPGLALMIAALISATCGALCALLGYNAWDTGIIEIWIASGLMFPYFVMSVYAIYLNLATYFIVKDYNSRNSRKLRPSQVSTKNAGRE